MALLGFCADVSGGGSWCRNCLGATEQSGRRHFNVQGCSQSSAMMRVMSLSGLTDGELVSPGVWYGREEWR